MKIKKQFIYGFVSAIGLLVIALVCLYLYLYSQMDSIVAQAFNPTADADVELKITVSEKADISGMTGKPINEIAEYLANGDKKLEESYFSILNSGLKVSLVVSYDDEDGSHSQTINISDGRSESSIFLMSSNAQLRWEDGNLHHTGIEELKEEIKTLIEQGSGGNERQRARRLAFTLEEI